MKFSLVIPIAPGRRAEILESISKSDYPKKDLEIITEEGTNTSLNRNKGMKRAKSDNIVFLDDDAFIEKDYFRKLKKFLEENKEIDIVGGPQLTPESDGFFAKTSGIVLGSSFGAFKVNQRYEKGAVKKDVDETALTTANLFVKKKVFNKVGGFDEDLWPGEDPEFIQRARKNEFKVAYDPDIKVFHKRRPTFPSFCKQFFKYGVVRPTINKKLNEFKIIFIIPMFFALYILFLPILSIASYLLLLPLLLYILLALLFSVIDSMRNLSIISLFFLPFLYFAIHFSYGLGVFTGYLTR